MQWIKPTPTPLGCYDCGLPYEGGHWVESVVPNDVWREISPTGNEGGILCINCIASRLYEIGLSDVPVKLTAGPLVTESKS